METTSSVALMNAEISKELSTEGVSRALLSTTFKGLSDTSMRQAILEGMIRGFKFKDFLEKNVYAIPYGQGYSLVTSIDFARKRGMRAGIVGKEAPLFTYGKGDRVEACSITVKRKVGDTVGEFTATVFFDEYSTGKNLWQTKPRTMLAKVAEMHALRMACPEELAQTYTEEEFEKEKDLQPKRMESYTVERKLPPDDADESGSASRMAVATEAAQEEPKKKEVDPVAQRLEIANLLKKHHKYTVLGKPEEEVAAKVMAITGASYKEENYAFIIDELRGK